MEYLGDYRLCRVKTSSGTTVSFQTKEHAHVGESVVLQARRENMHIFDQRSANVIANAVRVGFPPRFPSCLAPWGSPRKVDSEIAGRGSRWKDVPLSCNAGRLCRNAGRSRLSARSRRPTG